MTDGERGRAFRSELARRLRLGVRIQVDTLGEVVRLLGLARDRIVALLAAEPTEFQAWRLNALQGSVREVLGRWETEGGTAFERGIAASWDAGVALVDEPIAAGGVRLDRMLTSVDARQLVAMRAMATDRIRDVSTTLVNRINTEIGLAAIGTQTPFDAAGKIAGIVEDGGIRRAGTIVRTELGTAFAAAAQARMSQAVEVLPGLRKQWRRSGKVHSRFTHDAADGQIRPVDRPFDIGRAKLMHPRDPKADPAERINCGCSQLPYMAGWDVRHPRERPFSQEELDRSRSKGQIDQARAQAYSDWARRHLDALAKGEPRPDGTLETVGQLGPKVAAFLAGKRVSPTTAEIAVTDRAIVHMARAAKSAPVPEATILRLPGILSAPAQVLWDRRGGPRLLYVSDVADAKGRLAVFAVKLGDREKRARHPSHNWVTTAGMIEPQVLADRKSYESVA